MTNIESTRWAEEGKDDLHARRKAGFDLLNRYDDQKDPQSVVQCWKEIRWGKVAGDERTCPSCEEAATPYHNPRMPAWYCGPCDKYFSILTDTAFEGTRASLYKFLRLAYLMTYHDEPNRGLARNILDTTSKTTVSCWYELFEKVRLENWKKIVKRKRKVGKSAEAKVKGAFFFLKLVFKEPPPSRPKIKRTRKSR